MLIITRSSFEGDCPQAKELEEEDDACGGAFLLFEGLDALQSLAFAVAS